MTNLKAKLSRRFPWLTRALCSRLALPRHWLTRYSRSMKEWKIMKRWLTKSIEEGVLRTSHPVMIVWEALIGTYWSTSKVWLNFWPKTKEKPWLLGLLCNNFLPRWVVSTRNNRQIVRKKRNHRARLRSLRCTKSFLICKDRSRDSKRRCSWSKAKYRHSFSLEGRVVWLYWRLQTNWMRIRIGTRLGVLSSHWEVHYMEVNSHKWEERL